MSARTSAAGREPSPLPQQNNTTPGTNEAPQMKQSKKLSMSGKLFRLDSPAKSVKPTTPTTPRINGEGTDNSYRIPSMVFDESADGAQNTNPNGDSNRTSPARKSIPPISGAVRRVSDSIDVLANGDMPRAGALSPPSENQWSSAVGHATTNGKSGRVIERLMAENDRLKRELELQLLRSQELERNLETMRPQIEALRTENDNLNHANTMDEAMLARRDRKIEQLKEEAASERSRREASDLLARRLEREHEEVQETASRDVQLAQEQAKHSTTHATILEQSHRQLAQEYRQRAERWRKDITELQAQRQADGEKFARIDVVGEQMRSELERARKIQAEFVEKWDEYQSANEEWKNGVEHVADFENSRMRKLSEDMETITNKMKWVMALENSRGGGGS